MQQKTIQPIIKVKITPLFIYGFRGVYTHTVEPLLKDTPNKGHNTFDLSIKDKFYGPYRTMAMQFYL